MIYVYHRVTGSEIRFPSATGSRTGANGTVQYLDPEGRVVGEMPEREIWFDSNTSLIEEVDDAELDLD